MSESYDYTEHLEEPADQSDKMAQLATMARAQLEAEQAVTEAEEALRTAKDRLKQVGEHDLPGLMDELGLETFRTSDGISISVKETIRTSIPKAQQGEAFAWLRQNGHGGVIKHEMTVALGRDSELKAGEVKTLLKEQGLIPKDKQAVHHLTLSKLVKEQLEAGEDIPIELFGVYRQRKTKVNIK